MKRKRRLRRAWLLIPVLAVGLVIGLRCCHVHRYNETIVAPSCLGEGYTLLQCSCGAIYREKVTPALGHDYDVAVVEATYLSGGYMLHRCRLCGHEYRSDETAPPVDVVSSLSCREYLLPAEEFSKERMQNPTFVMLHFTSAVVLSPEDPYNKERIREIFLDYGVSVHYIIDREGGITCYVPEDRVAYHAGTGSWGDDDTYTNAMNEYAIGIEIMAIGSQADMSSYLTAEEYASLNPAYIGFTEAQYEALRDLLRDICQRNRIPYDRQHIIGHEEYSPSKNDPGERFDWNRLFS